MRFFGAPVQAEIEASRLLGIDWRHGEQDWEIVNASENQIERVLSVYLPHLHLDVRSALMLLLLHSLEEAELHGRATQARIAAIRNALKSDELVLERMQSYWQESGSESRKVSECLRIQIED